MPNEMEELAGLDPEYAKALRQQYETVGNPEWFDESKPLNDRVSDYLTVRGRQYADQPGQFDQRRYSEFADDVEKTFPGVDPSDLYPSLARVQQHFGGEKQLQKAREFYQDKKASTADDIASRMIPVFSSVLSFGQTKIYGDALARIREGEARPEDYNVVARHEKVMADEEKDSVGVATRKGLMHIPAILGEAALGGALLKGLGVAPAIAMGGRAAAPAAEAVAGLTTRQGAIAVAKKAAVAAPSWLSRTAAQTVLMPSMWLPESAARAVQHGGDWSDIKNLGPAYAMGMMQVGLLGAVSQIPGQIAVGAPASALGRSLGGTTAKAYFARLLAGTGTGMSGQQAIDATTSLIGWRTGYGLVGDILNQKGDAALKHAVVQTATFAVFSLLHAHHDPLAPGKAAAAAQERLMVRLEKYTDYARKNGQSPDQAGRSLTGLNQRFMQEVMGAKDPEAAQRKFVADTPEGPARDYVDGLGKIADIEARYRAEEEAAQATARAMAGSRAPRPGESIRIDELTSDLKAQKDQQRPGEWEPIYLDGYENLKAQSGQGRSGEMVDSESTSRPAVMDAVGRKKMLAEMKVKPGEYATWPEAARQRVEAEYLADAKRRASAPVVQPAAVEGLDPAEVKAMSQMGMNDAAIARAGQERIAAKAKPVAPEPGKPMTPGDAIAALGSGIGEAAAERATRYAERIIKGESPESVMDGIKPDGPTWRAVMERVEQLRSQSPPTPPDAIKPSQTGDLVKPTEPARAQVTNESGDVVKPEAVITHIGNYKTPKESVAGVIKAIESRSRGEGQRWFWYGEDGVRKADANQGQGLAALEFNEAEYRQVGESKFTGTTASERLVSNTLPDRFNPALKRITYRGSEQDPAWQRLKDGVEEMNRDRLDPQWQKEVGEKFGVDLASLKPVDLVRLQPKSEGVATKPVPPLAPESPAKAKTPGLSADQWSEFVEITKNLKQSSRRARMGDPVNPKEAKAARDAALEWVKDNSPDKGTESFLRTLITGGRRAGNTDLAPPWEFVELVNSSELNPREKHILIERSRSRTQDDIGKDPEVRSEDGDKAVSREWVRRLEAAAMRKLGMDEASMAKWIEEAKAKETEATKPKRVGDETEKPVNPRQPPRAERFSEVEREFAEVEAEEMARRQLETEDRAVVDDYNRKIDKTTDVKDLEAEELARETELDELFKRYGIEEEAAKPDNLGQAATPEGAKAAEGVEGTRGIKETEGAQPKVGEMTAARLRKFRIYRETRKQVRKDFKAETARKEKLTDDQTRWEKEITSEFPDLDPVEFHQQAKDLLDLDRESVRSESQMLMNARNTLAKHGTQYLEVLRNARTRGTKDASSIKGLDDVAKEMSANYPDFFPEGEDGATEILFDKLVRGNPKPMMESEAYGQAMEIVRSAMEVDSNPRARKAMVLPGKRGDAAEVANPAALDFDFGWNRAGVTEPKAPEVDPILEFGKQFAKEEGGYVTPEAIMAKGYAVAGFLGRVYQGVRTGYRRMAGEQFPKMTDISRDSGEAATRWAGTRAYAQQAAPEMIDLVMGPKAGTAERFRAGTVLTEMALRHTREAWQMREQQLLAEAAKTPAGQKYADLVADAAEAREIAKNVKTVIGAKGSVIANDAEFQAAKTTPEMQEIIARWKKHFVPVMEGFFRRSRGMADTDIIETFTQIPDMPVNLAAIKGEGKTASSIPTTGGRGNLKAMRQRRSVFENQRTGNADGYDVDIGRIIENTYQRSAEVAAKAEMYRTLVAEEVAEWGKPGEQMEGLKELPYVKPPPGSQEAENGQTSLYIKEAAYGELRQALQVDTVAEWKQVTNKIASIPTRIALASSVEAAYHSKNLLTLLLKPGIRLHDLVRNGINVVRGSREAKAGITELARIGAMKELGLESGYMLPESMKKYDPTFYAGRALDTVGKVMRLTANDAFNRLVRAKLTPDTQTGRANFINQLGNYNRKTQSGMIVWLRDTGLGPFATAGSNYWVQGLRALTFAPGVESTSYRAAFQMRAETAAKTFAAMGSVLALNYAIWGRVDGDDHTPLGAIKLGVERGRTVYFDLLALTGFSRGARQVGAMALMEGNRSGKDDGRIADKAVSDVAHGIVHPATGPAVAFGYTAFTGKNTLGNQIASQVSTAETAKGQKKAMMEGRPIKGDSQKLENLKAAIWQANPAIQSISGKDQPTRKREDIATWEILAKMLGPFGPKSRERMESKKKK